MLQMLSLPFSLGLALGMLLSWTIKYQQAADTLQILCHWSSFDISYLGSLQTRHWRSWRYQLL